MTRWTGQTRVLVAGVLGAAGLAAITVAGTSIASLDDRPGAALMAVLILIIGVTLIGGPVARLRGCCRSDSSSWTTT